MRRWRPAGNVKNSTQCRFLSSAPLGQLHLVFMNWLELAFSWVYYFLVLLWLHNIILCDQCPEDEVPQFHLQHSASKIVLANLLLLPSVSAWPLLYDFIVWSDVCLLTSFSFFSFGLWSCTGDWRGGGAEERAVNGNCWIIHSGMRTSFSCCNLTGIE